MAETVLDLIGIGTGNPDHLTLQGVAALRAADLVLIPRKGAEKADLAELRLGICAAHRPDGARIAEFDMPVRDPAAPYRAAVDDWHDRIAAAWAGAIAAHLPQGGRVALLVWGDPSLYDSSLRVAARLGLAVRVVPGITSLQALCAAHAITLNSLAAPVVVTTGRRLREGGWPAGADRVAVMLDEGCAFLTLAPDGVAIWWGAYLGLPHEALESGPLAEAGPRIADRRARLRARHGWIMDTYLLDRSAESPAQG